MNVRVLSKIKIVLLAAITVLIVTLTVLRSQAENASELTVYYIDVGQGDASLLRSGGQAMLIDTGTPESGTAIRLFLKKQGIEKLDYLVLTHTDADHIGGAASVITNVPVNKVLMPDYTKDNEIYLGVMDALDYKYLKPRAPVPGETLARLKAAGTHLFRTDKQGTITIRSDGRHISYDMAPCDDFTPGEMILKPQEVTGADAGVPDETLAATQVPETGTYKYVKNTNSHRFHLLGCDSVKDMKEKNKEYSNQSRDEIVAEGYKPCQRCMP